MRDRLLFVRLLAFVFILLLVACSGEKKEAAPETKDAAIYNELLSLYEEVSGKDTIAVFSVEDPEQTNFRFKGFALDSSFVRLLPAAVQHGTNDGYYACFKFSLDSSTIGLITRTPGKYVSSAICLLIFDKQKQAMIAGYELAEHFGESSESVDRVSKLYRKGNSWLCEKRITHSEYNDEDLSASVPEKRFENYLIKFFPLPPDTLKKNTFMQLHLGTETVELSGVLREEPFWGPPGYGEDTTVDKKETAYMLIPENPFDVSISGKIIARSMKKIQLASTTPLEDLKDKFVIVSGSFYEAATGHHHTPVLMSVDKIKPN